MRGLRFHRVTRSVTQAQVAKALGISQAQYSRLETGVCEINLTQMVRLADFYGVRMEELL